MQDQWMNLGYKYYHWFFKAVVPIQRISHKLVAYQLRLAIQ
jgi:hypothetical protein